MNLGKCFLEKEKVILFHSKPMVAILEFLNIFQQIVAWRLPKKVINQKHGQKIYEKGNHINNINKKRVFNITSLK